MILVILVAVLAFLYFKGASTQAAMNQAVLNSTPNTNATGVPSSQSSVNGDTFNHLLDTITSVSNAVNSAYGKTAQTTVEKNGA